MAITLPRRSTAHADRGPTARALALLTVLVLLTLGMSVASPAPTARAATGDVGVEGLSHSGTGTPTGTKRAESVLWWNDGSWWGNLWDTVSGDFHIFRLDTDHPEVAGHRRHHRDPRQHPLGRPVGRHHPVRRVAPVRQRRAAGPAGLPERRLFRYTYNSSTKTYVVGRLTRRRSTTTRPRRW